MASLEGQAQLLARLKAIGAPRPILSWIQTEAVREAKLLVPRKTSNLGRSIQPGTLTDSYAIVEAQANYAAHVELGTRPHKIRPRKKGKVLAWPATAAGRKLSGAPNVRALRGSSGLGRGGIRRVGPLGPASGTFRYAASVNHPGTRAQPYLVPGAKAAIERGGLLKRYVDAWNGAA